MSAHECGVLAPKYSVGSMTVELYGEPHADGWVQRMDMWRRHVQYENPGSYLMSTVAEFTGVVVSESRALQQSLTVDIVISYDLGGHLVVAAVSFSNLEAWRAVASGIRVGDGALIQGYPGKDAGGKFSIKTTYIGVTATSNGDGICGSGKLRSRKKTQTQVRCICPVHEIL
jgi:hypothetical protein